MINGKATIVDPDTQRPIYIGEGALPQIEACANKYVYSGKPNLHIWHQMLSDMADKCQADVGNHMIMVVNRVLWNQMNLVLGQYLADAQTDGTYLYSKSANKGEGGYVKVGATFNTYEFA